MDKNRIIPIILLLYIFSDSATSNVYNGITLYSNGGNLGPSNTFLINNSLHTINTWSHPAGVVGTPYLLQDKTLIVQLRSEQHHFGESHGPIGGRFNKIDWDGTVLWEFFYYDSSYHPHHDIEPMPNGNILVLCWEKKTYEEAQNFGRININEEMWPLKIVEIQPIGSDDANIVWQWHLWDHLVQDVDSLLPNYNDIGSHPELIDINLGQFTNENSGDWLHTNAIAYNPDLDQIVFSSRHLDEIFIIDHSTTNNEAASHMGGNNGMGGDILYRWGNPENYNRGDESDKMLNAQHGVNWILDDYPGAGNLLIFNNNPSDTSGQDHTVGNSSVVEIITPLNVDGGYDISTNSGAYGPIDYIWEYGGDNSFFSHFQSGAYRLPNGNTIATVSQEKYIFEIDTLDQITWEYYFENQSGLNGNTARAQKYQPNYFTFSLGDMNFDYVLSIEDLNIICNLIFENNPYLENGDMNQDNIIDNDDIDLIVDAIFLND